MSTSFVWIVAIRRAGDSVRFYIVLANEIVPDRFCVLRWTFFSSSLKHSGLYLYLSFSFVTNVNIIRLRSTSAILQYIWTLFSRVGNFDEFSRSNELLFGQGALTNWGKWAVHIFQVVEILWPREDDEELDPWEMVFVWNCRDTWHASFVNGWSFFNDFFVGSSYRMLHFTRWRKLDAADEFIDAYALLRR